MADYLIMKAVEHAKLPAKFRKQYPTVRHLEAAGYWLQKKYDGCMGVAHMRFNGGSTMQSRTGEDYTTSCGNILQELREAADETGSWDDFVVIGEVWQPIEQASFPTISGKFRRQSLSTDLMFIANDILPPGLNTDRPYFMRYNDLQLLLPEMGTDEACCHIADTYFPGDYTDAMASALAWQGAGGYDGAILRSPSAGYTVGTVKNGEIVKVKPVLSLDLKVQGVIRDVGEKTGRDVWKLEVKYLGVYSIVGSGVPHDIRDINGGEGIAEIECLGITADGKLREPRFKGMRFDKLKPD